MDTWLDDYDNQDLTGATKIWECIGCNTYLIDIRSQ
jgi:hypothetical protein